jgi:WD40 repeat protein
MTATTLGEPILSATLSAYGSRLATAVRTVATVWDVETGAELARLAHVRAVVAVALDTEGDRAATVSLDNTLRIFDAASGNLVGTSYLGFSDSELKQLETTRNVELLALSPDGSRVAVATPNAWRNTESAGPRLKRGWSTFAGPYGVIDATPSNRDAMTFDASTGAPIAGDLRRPVIARSPDGRRHITARGDTLTVIDSTSLRTLSDLDTNHAPSARFSRDGSKLVVSGSREPSARLWLEGVRTDSGEKWHAASRGIELFPRDDNRATPPDVSPDVTRDWLALSRLHLDHRWLLPALLIAALALAALFERLLLRRSLARYEHG